MTAISAKWPLKFYHKILSPTVQFHGCLFVVVVFLFVCFFNKLDQVGQWEMKHYLY